MIHQCICFTISGKITRSGSCLAILTQTEAADVADNSITVSFHRKRLDEATAEDGGWEEEESVESSDLASLELGMRLS